MTSPSTTSAQPSDSSQTLHGASSNGVNINGEGAVQLPNAPTSVNGPEAASHENNAIFDGKQKAKAVLAASGVNIPEAQVDMASATPAEAINGASPNRKRSRSGTRKSSQTPSRETGSESKANQAALLNRYIARDLLDSVNKYERKEHSEKVYGELSDLRHFYRDEVFPVRRQNAGAIFGYGYAGYGNGETNLPPPDPRQPHIPRLVYPTHAKRAGRRMMRSLLIVASTGET